MKIIPVSTRRAAARARACSTTWPRFKRPEDYRFVDALPTNNDGKVVERELRDLLRAETVDNPERIPRRPVS
jgi:long-chain acyl-CoA synthetase